MQTELSSVTECLRRSLMQYKQSRPALSWRAIAKQSGVNRYFINKILDEGSQEKQSLDFSQVLILAKFLSQKKSIKDTIDSQEPPVREALRKALDVIYSTEYAHKDVEVMDQEDAVHFESFLILILAHKERGIPQSDIVKILGQHSAATVASLEARGKIVLSANGNIRLVRAVYLHINRDLQRFHMQNIIARFAPTGENPSYSHIYVSRVNRCGLEKVIQAHEEFHRAIKSIGENEENLGNIPTFSLGCTGPMLRVCENDLNE